jgi:hypothetical protein
MVREHLQQRRVALGALGIMAAVVVMMGADCVPAMPTGGSQTFSVEYQVSGTFDSCTVFYITRKDEVAPQEVNQGGQNNDEDVTLPWSHSFDVTVTAMFPFNTQVNAVCSGADEQSATVKVLVDGVEQDSATETGQNVNAQAGYTITVQ